MIRKSQKTIYLDYAATTPLAAEVLKAMEPYFLNQYGNPSSPHQIGRKALAALDKARDKVAHFLNCSTQEIIFTSGATESNNLAIRGVVKACRSIIKRPEIITTTIEHPSVLKTCQDLVKEGVRVIYLPVNKEGVIKINVLPRFITPATVLITVMYANNEIGTIEPIREIGKLVEKINRVKLEKKERSVPIIFHTDAVQAIPFLNCDVNYLQVDLLSLSGHKISGPKGIGALYVRKKSLLAEVQTGGGQEYGLRAGTQNVAGIVGLGKAVEIITKNQKQKNKKMSQWRDWLINELATVIPGFQLIGPRGEKRLPNNIYLRMKGVLGEDLMILFDQEAKIAISTGAACSTGALEPSHVLLGLGFNKEEAREGLRITLGKNSTKSELKIFLSYLKKFTQKA